MMHYVSDGYTFTDGVYLEHNSNIVTKELHFRNVITNNQDNTTSVNVKNRNTNVETEQRPSGIESTLHTVVA